jgi:DNA-binding protein YbaB
MFDSLKAAGALAGLMRNKEALAAAGARIQSRLDSLRVEGQAAGGAVRVTVNGKMKVTEVRIDPTFAAHALAPDPAAAGAIIAAATNAAIDRAQALVKEEIQHEAKALGLDEVPGLDKLMSLTS